MRQGAAQEVDKSPWQAVNRLAQSLLGAYLTRESNDELKGMADTQRTERTRRDALAQAFINGTDGAGVTPEALQGQPLAMSVAGGQRGADSVPMTPPVGQVMPPPPVGQAGQVATIPGSPGQMRNRGGEAPISGIASQVAQLNAQAVGFERAAALYAGSRDPGDRDTVRRYEARAGEARTRIHQIEMRLDAQSHAQMMAGATRAAALIGTPVPISRLDKETGRVVVDLHYKDGRVVPHGDAPDQHVLPREDIRDPNGVVTRSLIDRNGTARPIGLAPVQPGDAVAAQERGFVEARAAQGRETTESERRNAGFAMRMHKADEEMVGMEARGAHTGRAAQRVAHGVPIVGNFLTDKDFQVYLQRMEDWVRAKLRLESGAVINPDEWKKEVIAFFPQPGDTAEAIDAKRRAREISLDAVNISAGRSRIELGRPPAGPSPPRTNVPAPPAAALQGLKPGMIRPFKDGSAWTVDDAGKPVKVR